MEENALLPNLAHWTDVNFAPGIGRENHLYQNQGICPHFGLISEAAIVAGMNPKELASNQEFCGRYVSFGDAVTPEGQCTTCARVAEKLGELVQASEMTARYPIKTTGKISFSCNDAQLEEKLRRLINRKSGERQLSVIVEGVKALARKNGEACNITPKEAYQKANDILWKLCKIALGVKNFDELAWYLFGSWPAGKGCKQRPEKSLDGGIL